MVKSLAKSKKHKKLKSVDPFYSGERKLLLDKGLITANQAPKKEEENVEKCVTGRLKEYLELKNQYDSKKKEILTKINSKKGVSKRQRNKQKRQAVLPGRIAKQIEKSKPDDKGAEQPVRQVQNIERLPFESDVAFLNRVETHTQNVINRSKYEAQFDVKLETKDGQVVFKKEKKMSEKKRRRLEKLKDKIKNKKMDKKMEAENKQKRSEVKFGEVVHAPPEFTVFPKKRGQNAHNLTIPQATKNGLTEKDRNQVIERYRLMKSQGKFK